MRYGLMLMVLACASVAQAQTTAPITAEVLTVYRQGQSTPAVSPVVLPRATRVCDQAIVPPPAGTVPNPREVAWADPANPATRDCEWTDPGNGVLAMLAADAAVVYEATLRFRTAAGDTAESPRSNLFTRPGVTPAAPARVSVRSGS